MRLQNGVAFRVRHDEPQPRELHFVQGPVDCRRNGNLIEFQKQVILLIDAVLSGLLAQQRQILGAQMKIAAGCHLEPITDLPLQFIAEAEHLREIKPVAVVGVWGSHNARYAVGDRRLCHFH